MQGDDKKVLGDIIDAVVVYNKDYQSRSKEEKEYIEVEDVDTPLPNAKLARVETSSDKQLSDLASLVFQGDDRAVVRKKISKILRSGDPLTESKTVMVVLARKELENALRLMDNISRLDAILLNRVENGEFDELGDFEINSILTRLEKSLGRSLTIVEKVLDKPEYEEFLLAYREEMNEDDLSNISTVAKDKKSRDKLRNLIRDISAKL